MLSWFTQTIPEIMQVLYSSSHAIEKQPGFTKWSMTASDGIIEELSSLVLTKALEITSALTQSVWFDLSLSLSFSSMHTQLSPKSGWLWVLGKGASYSNSGYSGLKRLEFCLGYFLFLFFFLWFCFVFVIHYLSAF